MITIDWATRNRPVPRKRAIVSDIRPKASGSYVGVSRREGRYG
jgi:hypothetical protein